MIYLGTSGWSYDDWIGTFYPDDLSRSQWLPFYTQFFNAVEVNASFYRLPFENMVKGWDTKAPKDFFFTFKGSRVITHYKKLKNIDDSLLTLYNRLSLMTNHLYNILWQLPPFLKRDDILLESFLAQLDNKIPHIIEFRHPSWFTNEVYQLLETYKVAFCIISAPKLKTNIEVTTDFAYIRWHGKNDWYKYNYSPDELHEWAHRIQQLDVDTVFGYFNNDYDAYAPKNCQYLQQLLNVDIKIVDQ